MATFAQSDEDIRRYLLGLLDDENTLASIDDRLFADDEFADHLEVIEEELINDQISGKLNDDEAEAFRARMAASHTLRTKVVLASSLRDIALERSFPEAKPSFFDSIFAFFKLPVVIGGFAVLLITAVLLVVWLPRSENTELADLRSIYRTERPTESRISDFEYAPLVTRRGAAEDREVAKLRRIELALLERTERSPSSAAFHDLGRFYLTQQRFADAIKALERSISLGAANTAAINDLGSTYFERAKNEAASDRYKTLTVSLEKFAHAVELSPRDVAPAFNYAKCLQALVLNAEAKKAWQRYLELDSNSGWASEARKALETLEQTSVVRTKEQAVESTLADIAAGDADAVWNIQSQTRDMVTDLWIPGQLIGRLIDARARGDSLEAKRSIEAMRYIGELERSRSADFFVSELAAFYGASTDLSQLSKAGALLKEGYVLLNTKKTELARQKFVESRDLFSDSGDRWLSMMADLWVAHALTDLSKIEESDRILDRLSIECSSRRYVWLGLHTDDWASNNRQLRNEIGESIAINRKVLKGAETFGDAPLINRSNGLLAARYDSIGESERALTYLGHIRLDLAYGTEGSRRWRRNSSSSDALFKLGNIRVAELFAREGLFNAQSGILKTSQAVDDSLRDLITINVEKGDFVAALEYADATRQRALSTEDPVLRNKMLRYAMLRIAELKYDLGDPESALAAYDEVISLQAVDSEVPIDHYDANRGRTLTLIALERDIDEQLAITVKMSEEFRSQILDQGSRIAFLASERELAEAMVANSIKRGDIVEGFELSELSRSRGLLDFVGTDASIEQLEARFPTVSKTSSLRDLQNAIPQNVQLIEYAVLKDKLAIWLVTADGLRFAETAISDKDLAGEVDQLLKTTVQKFANDNEIRASSARLYDLLIGPVKHLIDKQKQLVVIPDGPLGKLPFAMLANDGRYLIEDFAISYSPSANVFAHTTLAAKKRRVPIERLLAVGSPAFDRSEQPLLDALPSAATEARNVAELYSQASTLVGSDATKARILDALPLATTIHHAGHYVVNESSPANSRLVLAAGSESPDLKLDELIDLRLYRSMLVVLSACDTNTENIVAGEGSTGIAQKFIAIGAPLVVAGNWKVDSDSTSVLMQAFHKNRRIEKMNSAEALRQAQLAAMRDKNGALTPPYYWAAFAAIGGYTDY